jgi:hypothetical protein
VRRHADYAFVNFTILSLPQFLYRMVSIEAHKLKNCIASAGLQQSYVNDSLTREEIIMW